MYRMIGFSVQKQRVIALQEVRIFTSQSRYTGISVIAYKEVIISRSLANYFLRVSRPFEESSRLHEKVSVSLISLLGNEILNNNNNNN